MDPWHGWAVKATMATLNRFPVGFLTPRSCSARASHAITSDPSNVGSVIGGVLPGAVVSPKRFKSSLTNLSHDKEGQRRTSNCFQVLAGPFMAIMETSTRLSKGVLLRKKYWYAHESQVRAPDSSNVGKVINGAPQGGRNSNMKVSIFAIAFSNPTTRSVASV